MDPQLEASTQLIFDNTQRCHDAFQKCTLAPKLMEGQWAENRLADFNLWAASVGASTHGPACLDSRLAGDALTHGVVVSLLLNLGLHVDECESLAHEEPIAPQGSATPVKAGKEEDSEDTQEEDTQNHVSLKEAMSGAEDLLDELIRMGVAIRRAGRKSRLRNADRSFHPGDYLDLRNYLVQILLGSPSLIENHRNKGKGSIRFDFTEDRLRPEQEHLVNANLIRRHRFIKARHHGEKLASHRLEGHPSAGKRRPTHAVTESQPVVASSRTGSGDTAKRAGKERATQGEPAHSTSQAGMSVNTKYSEYSQIQPPTVPSRKAPSSTAAKVDYPPKPKKALEPGLRSFKCPCCWQSLPSTMSNSQWKKHLADDLCPYTCIFPNCTNVQTLYVTRKQWMTHMSENHRSPSYWKCFACRDLSMVFHDRELLLNHINELHPDVVSDNQLSTLVDMCQKSDSAIIHECPLCPWTEEWALREHLREEHGSVAGLDEPIYWECMACREYPTFDDEEDLERHQSEFHGHTRMLSRPPIPGDEAGPNTTTLGFRPHQRWQCQSCRSPAFFVDKDDLQKHVDHVHPGIDAEDSLPTFVEMCGVGGDSTPKSCPFCTWTKDTSSVPDQTSLLDHVAQHIHSFSLHALPWASEGSRKPHASHQFGDGEYFADEDDASQRAQVDGNVDVSRRGDDILEHMREVMAARDDADARPRMVNVQLYQEDEEGTSDVKDVAETTQQPKSSPVFEVHVEFFIQGSESPDGFPASLVVFRFRSHQHNPWQSFKKIRTTIRFRADKISDWYCPEVAALWPMGPYTGRRLAKHEDASELGGQSAKASTYIEEGEDRATLSGEVLVSLDQTANTISLTAGMQEMSASGIATEFHAVALLRWPGMDDFVAEVDVEAEVASSRPTERHRSRIHGRRSIPLSVKRQIPASMAPLGAGIEELDINNLGAAFNDIVRVLEMKWRPLKESTEGDMNPANTEEFPPSEHDENEATRPRGRSRARKTETVEGGPRTSSGKRVQTGPNSGRKKGKSGEFQLEFISSYHLRWRALRDWLTARFEGQNLNLVEQDSWDWYEVYLPRRLTQEERDEIYVLRERAPYVEPDDDVPDPPLSD